MVLTQSKSYFRNYNFSKIAQDWNSLIRADFTDQISALHCVIQPPFNIKLSICMFPFRINCNIIYIRDKLFRAKIVENDKCQACGSKQTLVHLLVELYVDTFCNSLFSWWNSCKAPRVALTVDKIYAHHPEKLSFCTLNFCLIVARFYIYTASKENEPLSFLAFKILLKSKWSTEPSYASSSPCVFSKFLFLYCVGCLSLIKALLLY